jgi:hypothetical protein
MPPSHKQGTKVAKNAKNVDVSGGVLLLMEPPINTNPGNAAVTNTVSADASCQRLGSIQTALQFEQAYFAWLAFIEPCVSHTETAIFLPHDGQENIFPQRNSFFMP